MGLFSSETEATVAVSNNKLFDSDDLPNTIKDAVFSAIYKNQDIPSHLQMAALTNFSANVRRYLYYGRTQYYRGLPTATGNFYDTDPVEVQAAIESEVGEPVTLLFSDVVDTVTPFDVYEYLQDDYGWTQLVNEINFGGTIYQLIDTEYESEYECIPDPLDPSTWDCVSNPNRFKITYGEVGNLINQRIEYWKLPGKTGPRYNVRYYLDSSVEEDFRYWAYTLSDGTYPELDQSKGQPVDGTFYPVASIRENFKYTNKDTSSEEYKTTDRLLKKINLDLNVLTDAIKENPDREDIHSAFITLSLNMDTTLDLSTIYLHTYFRELFFIQAITKEKYDQNIANDPLWQSKNKYIIEESKYNTTIRFDYITLNNSGGNIGPVGTLTKTREDIPAYIPTGPSDPNPYTPRKINYTFVIQTVTGIETLYIANLYTKTKISDERYTNSDEILIPVKVELLTPFNSFQEEQILLDSLHLVAYAYREVEIKWYETGFAQFLIKIAIIAISIYFGPVAGAELGTALAAAAAGEYALIIALLTDFLITFAINYAIIWLAQEVGGVLGAALIALSYYYLPVQYGGAGGQINGMPFAETMLKASSSYLGIQTQEIQTKLEDLQEESVEFAESVESRQEELDKASELLGSVNYAFDPLYILDVGIYFNPDERPEDFYRRTLNFDPGAITLEAVDYYVEGALTLPESDKGLPSLEINTERESSSWFMV